MGKTVGKDNVDGSEIPNNHLGCMIPYKQWDKLSTYQLVSRISAINSMEVQPTILLLNVGWFCEFHQKKRVKQIIQKEPNISGKGDQTPWTLAFLTYSSSWGGSFPPAQSRCFANAKKTCEVKVLHRTNRAKLPPPPPPKKKVSISCWRKCKVQGKYPFANSFIKR